MNILHQFSGGLAPDTTSYEHSAAVTDKRLYPAGGVGLESVTIEGAVETGCDSRQGIDQGTVEIKDSGPDHAGAFSRSLLGKQCHQRLVAECGRILGSLGEHFFIKESIQLRDLRLCNRGGPDIIPGLLGRVVRISCDENESSYGSEGASENGPGGEKRLPPGAVGFAGKAHFPHYIAHKEGVGLGSLGLVNEIPNRVVFPVVL